jgi:ParB family chromosome partitioning protein
MLDKKTAPRLGRGLDALLGIPTDGAQEIHHATPDGASTRVPIHTIQLNPYQPRKNFDEEELQQLAESIRQHGVLSPILVRRIEGGYQLISGERRLRAAQLVGLAEIPVHIRDMDEQQVLEAALVENIQRTDLNPIEKALGFREYLDKFRMTQEQLAQRIGVDRTTITNLLGLLNLPAEVQDHVRTGALSLGHAKILKGLSNPNQQIALAKQVIASSLSVHALEALLKEQKPERPASKNKSVMTEPERTAHVDALENELRQRLAVRVSIKLKGKDKGQIILPFENNDDFERLLERLRH